ncbi:MAG TPA: type III pantothenate kinase [Bacteroidota bacterium]|jgi:type III pantothenate kinase
MLLAIDVGNTDTVLGLFSGDQLVDEWRMPSKLSLSARDLRVYVRTFAAETGAAPDDIEGVVISSVNPRLTKGFGRMAKNFLGTTPLIITGDMDAGMTVHYDDPSRLGADRLCNAVAAFSKYGGPAIVIDFGTATTFDVISAKGEYLGGVIAPGVETAAAGLSGRTAVLPRVDLLFPERVIGTNTVAGMQAGIMYGALEATEGIVRRIKGVIGKKATVIATGGYARIIAEQSGSIVQVEPALVLEGARLIYERLRRERRA